MRFFTLTNAELLSPGTTPITEATTTLCDQDNCSKVITFVSTAINTVSAMRINQERTIDLKTNKSEQKSQEIRTNDFIIMIRKPKRMCSTFRKTYSDSNIFSIVNTGG